MKDRFSLDVLGDLLVRVPPSTALNVSKPWLIQLQRTYTCIHYTLQIILRTVFVRYSRKKFSQHTAKNPLVSTKGLRRFTICKKEQFLITLPWISKQPEPQQDVPQELEVVSS